MASRPSASTPTTGSTTRTPAIARAANWPSVPARRAIGRGRANLSRLRTLGLRSLRPDADSSRGSRASQRHECMSQRSQSRLVLGMLAALAVIVGARRRMLLRSNVRARARASTASCTAMPQSPRPACRAAPETLACYERLDKIAQFAPLPIRPSPRNARPSIWCGSTAIADARPDSGGAQSAADASLQHGGGGGGMDPRRRRRPPPPNSARRSPPITEVDSYECRGRNNIAGRQAVRARQGQRARHQRHQASQRRHVQPDRPARVASRSASGCAPWPAAASRRCWGRAPTAITRSTSISISRERSHGYRICQWDVLDPAALAAEVPLPRPRPIEPLPPNTAVQCSK